MMGDTVRVPHATRAVRYALRAMALATIFAITAHAQTTPQVSFAATSAHVGQPGSPVNIKLFRWSTDEERGQLVAAMNPPPPPPPPPPAPAPPPPAADAAPPDAAPPDAAPPDAAPAAPPAAAPPDGARGAAGGERGGAAGRAGRAGQGGRGGRGRGAAPPPAPPLTPIQSLTGAIGKAPTIGYIWTDEVTGYSIKYAWHAPISSGGERIVLATNRVLGGQSPQWKPDGTQPPTEYEFTLIELRVNAKGIGEGKTSLTTKVVTDAEAKTIALENYAAAPVILQNVKRS